MDYISTFQTTAGDNVIQCYNELVPCIRWVLLFAQMQSGKTTTYLYVACESIRLELVDKVIIFSGNAEVELKDQVNSDADNFVSKYCRDHNLEFLSIRRKINVMWSHDISKKRNAEKNTLFIWDESHSAQNIGNRPGKFLDANGISGDGDQSKLERNNNYFLSVSATPFSEISDMAHEGQMKKKITLKVSDQYFGLEQMLRNNNIRSYSSWRTALKQAFAEHKSQQPKYSIVRVKDDRMGDEVKRMAASCGWHSINYNSKSKGISSLNDLNTAPTRNTVIIIKAMCRMGKVVPKQHIAFCMETSNQPNTDVVLQGLLGRMMGWNANRDVIIYLNEKVFSFNELESYVRLYNGESIIPSKATNVLSRDGYDSSDLHPIIPICIRPSDRIIDDSEDNPTSREYIIMSVKTAFHNNRFENYNEPKQLEEIRNKVLTFEYPQFEVRNLSQKTYASVLSNIREAIDSRKPAALGSSAGIAADGQEIKIYKNGDVWYIDARTASCSKKQERENKLKYNIPLTTKKEIFCRHEENGTEVMANGGNVVGLPIESCTDAGVMMLSIIDFINHSLMPSNVVQFSRHITSVRGDHDWQGICVSDQVLEALSKNGSIYRAIQTQFGLTLKLTKSRGRRSKELVELGLNKLMEISW